MKFLTSLIFVFFILGETLSVPIETPDNDERNDFVVRCPPGWGYRTFKGDSGLIGVFWPMETSFNLTDTAIFVFLQDNNKPIPKVPVNIHLFEEKCTKAKFKFATAATEKNPTKSLGEKYFRGRCGRTMIVSEVIVGNYRIIVLIASAKRYITKQQIRDFKEIVRCYKDEARDYAENGKIGNIEDYAEDEVL